MYVPSAFTTTVPCAAPPTRLFPTPRSSDLLACAASVPEAALSSAVVTLVPEATGASFTEETVIDTVATFESSSPSYTSYVQLPVTNEFAPVVDEYVPSAFTTTVPCAAPPTRLNVS